MFNGTTQGVDRRTNRRSAESLNASTQFALLEQIGMRADAHKDDLLIHTAALQLVDEQKVAADVAFAVVGPVADKCVVQPLRAERPSAQTEVAAQPPPA